MGTIMKSCINCNKKKEQETKPSLRTMSRTMKIDIKDKFCKGTITIEEDISEELPQKINNSIKTIKQSICLYTNQFNSDPWKTYKLVKDFSPNQKIISLISNPIMLRFMTIMEGGNNTLDIAKKKILFDRIKDIQSLDHPNLFKVYEIYMFDNKYYIISIYTGTESLLEKIKMNKTIEEPIIKTIINQILAPLNYLHQNLISDIGLQLNRLIISEMALKTSEKKMLKKRKKTKEMSGEIKCTNSQDILKKQNSIGIKITIKISISGYLIDSYDISNLNSIKYYSPEIIEQIEKGNLTKNNIFQEDDIISEDEKKDEWVCGVILYNLITGEFPFEGKTKEEIFNNIKNEEIDYTSSKFNYVSDECKDFLSKLLEKDKNKRISINKCFDHPFLSSPKKIYLQSITENIYSEYLTPLLYIKKPKSKFHEIVIAYLCYNFIDKDEEKKLTDLFTYIDVDHNGVLSIEDLKNAFNNNDIEYTEEQINNVLYVFDYDKNNNIQYQEFLRVLCNKKNLFNEENLRTVFNAIDADKSNTISFEDIEKFVTHDEKAQKQFEKEIMEPLGMKLDDAMSFEKFCEIMREDKVFNEVN